MNKLDHEKLAKFGERFVDDIGAMMLGCLTHIGLELDLFTHMSKFDNFSSADLAQSAGCNERYIREWLCALTCAGWVEYGSDSKLWKFPPEHQHYLVNRETKDYCGGVLGVIQPFYTVAPKMLSCFRDGGGLTQAEIHPRIGEIVENMTRPSQRYWVPELVEQYLADVHHRLTEGINVADVGCGTGNSLISMSLKYPKSKFWGFEPHPPSVLRAKANLLEAGCSNVIVVEATSAAMETDFFDFITSWDVVHDLSDPESFVADIFRALRAAGVYLMNEPDAYADLGANLSRNRTFLYSLSTMHCLTVSLANGGPGYGACMGEKVPEEICSKVGFSRFSKLESPACLFRIAKQ